MSVYNGTIDLISGLRPKNNGAFPLVNAKDVQVDDTGKRLDTRLSELAEGAQGSLAIASFDLAALGLPAITVDGAVVTLSDVELTALMSALATGTVQVSYLFTVTGSEQTVTSVLHAHRAGNQYLCTIPFYVAYDLNFVTFIFTASSVSAYAFSLGYFNEIKRTLPTFDLVSLGLPAIPLTQETVTLETDTTKICEALAKGAVKFIFNVEGITVSFEAVMNPIYADQYVCYYTADRSGVPFSLVINVSTTAISAHVLAFADELPTVTSEEDGMLLQVVDGEWAKVSVEESSIKTYIDSYINEALGGDY